MKEKLQRFMAGRYGSDQLNGFLLGAAVVCLLLSVPFRSAFLNTASMLLLILCYVRMLSRNIRKRYDENMKFMQYANKVSGFFKRQKSYMQQRKTHHIYKCPTCKQKIRVPKGKGKSVSHVRHVRQNLLRKVRGETDFNGKARAFISFGYRCA